MPQPSFVSIFLLFKCTWFDDRVLFRETFYCTRQVNCGNAKIRSISIGSPRECTGGCRMSRKIHRVNRSVSILRSGMVNAINFTVYESLRKEIALWEKERGEIGR
jgi:hypothetical protein